MVPPAQTYVPQRVAGALRPHRNSAPIRPVGCMRGLDSAAGRTASLVSASRLLSLRLGARTAGGAIALPSRRASTRTTVLVAARARLPATSIGTGHGSSLWRRRTFRRGSNAGRCCLTICASAAGDHGAARTTYGPQRAQAVPWPHRDSAPIRPVGCVRGLGGRELLHGQPRAD
jgi:hypothetical protein